MVSMQRLSDLSHFCGGTLVAPDLVLTTNECVVTTTASEIAVRVGGFSITNPLPDSELFAVNSIVARPPGVPMTVLAPPKASYPTIWPFWSCRGRLNTRMCD